MSSFKFAFLFAFFFFAFKSQAQDRKFDFGISVFPNFSFGIISNDGNVSEELEETIKELEISKPSIGARAFVEYKITEKSILGFAIAYDNNGERTKKIDLIPPQSILDPLLPSQTRNIYNHHNLILPVYYKYKFNKMFYVSSGLGAVYNISNTSTSISFYSDGSKQRSTQNDDITTYRKVNFFLDAGFGMCVFSDKKISVFLEPKCRYTFLGVSKTAPLNRNYFSVGISAGIIF